MARLLDRTFRAVYLFIRGNLTSSQGAELGPHPPQNPATSPEPTSPSQTPRRINIHANPRASANESCWVHFSFHPMEPSSAISLSSSSSSFTFSSSATSSWIAAPSSAAAFCIIETLLPKDENGDVLEFFTQTSELYDWVRQVIDPAWENPTCGNGYCAIPIEYPAFGYHGCLADCGVANTTAFTLQLTPRFVMTRVRAMHRGFPRSLPDRSHNQGAAPARTLRVGGFGHAEYAPWYDMLVARLQGDVAAALETVSFNLCTDDAEPLCWFPMNVHFTENFETVRVDNITLPDGSWTLSVFNINSSTGLVVGGLIESSDQSSATYSDMVPRRALYISLQAPGGRLPVGLRAHVPMRRAGCHGMERAALHIVRLRRRLQADGARRAPGLSDTVRLPMMRSSRAAPRELVEASSSASSEDAGDANSSESPLVVSAYSDWLTDMDAQMANGTIASAEHCQILLDVAHYYLTVSGQDCAYLQRFDTVGEFYCCPIFE
ncbi:TRP-like ion channel Pkd2, partial [Cymbomonas tetramitiformis]